MWLQRFPRRWGLFDGSLRELVPTLPLTGVSPIATQIVMDQTGDTRHLFDPQNAGERLEAERRFHDLTGRGFTAAKRIAPGQTSKLRSFDPTAEETVFFPRLVGG